MINILLKSIKILPFGRQTVLSFLLESIQAQRKIIASVGGLTLSLDLTENIDKHYLIGNWDKEEVSFLLDSIQDNNVFVDVGANQGFYSLMIAKKRPGAKIISFEPDPYSILIFEENIKLNDIRNINLIRKAVSNSSDSMELMINTAGNRGGSSVLLSQTKWTQAAEDVCLTVECLTLYEAMTQCGVRTISALKIDIEGFEYPVLKKFYEDAPKSLYP